MTLPNNKKLVDSTMEGIRQIKRTRFARRLLVILFALSAILFFAKWINNDLFYFFQLALYKFTVVKNQSGLYWQAVRESLPQQQLVVMVLASILWMSWKRFETFLFHSRINNTRQELLMKIIKITPRLVVINSVVVLTMVGFVGYGYAQKTEQKKLQLLREHINQTGRTEFETSIPTDQCDSNSADKNLTNQFEIKKGANITREDAKKIIEAACYNAEAEKFLKKIFINKASNDPTVERTTSIVSQIINKDGNIIVITPLSVSYNSNPDTQTITLSQSTKIYKNKKLVSQNTLQENDIIMLVTDNQYASTEYGQPSGDVINRTVLGIYILPAEPTFEWYNLTLQHSLTQIEMCKENPQDRCMFTGGTDFFPSGGGEGDTRNPEYIDNPKGIVKNITGVLTEVGDTSVKIKTSSGRIFTINFGSDPVSKYNQERAQYFNNEKVGIGDTLLVTYSEPANEHATTISTKQIFNAQLMLEIINKTDPVEKY